MNIKLSPVKITKENPFQNDALNRLESAEILTQFVSSLDQPYVIAIDSPWGTGKTTFLKMWQLYLKEKGFNSLYFNAWETDFKDDALVALIKEIEINLDSFELGDRNSEIRKILQKVKKSSYVFVKKALPAAVKIATYGTLDIEKTVEDTIADTTEKFIEEQFEEYEKTKESLSSFKKNLQEFIRKLNSEDKPLIFIIDELDRCRPDYAVQVLERAKHLFSIDKIVFVLGIDKEQVGHSLKTIYGEGMNVDGYLNRFIDYDYHLPEPDVKTFVEHTIERHELNDFFTNRKGYDGFGNDNNLIKGTLVEIFTELNLSLRTIEQLISQIVIVINVTKENQHLYPNLLCFLIIVRKINPVLYKQIIGSEVSPNEALQLFQDTLKTKLFMSTHFAKVIKAYMEVSMMCANREYKPLKKYNEIVDSDKTDEIEKRNAKFMINLIGKIEFDHSFNIIEYLVKKIEISYRFE